MKKKKQVAAKMVNWTKELGVARVLEKDGKRFLRLPKKLIADLGLQPGDEARWRRENGRQQLPPEQLGALTQKMVDAKTETTATKLIEQIVAGFYGVPDGYVVSFFRRGRPVIPKGFKSKSSPFPKFSVPQGARLLIPASIKSILSDEGVGGKANPRITAR
jgi:hypothetical protein